jgi:type II secretory pathway pseudopilin PulG
MTGNLFSKKKVTHEDEPFCDAVTSGRQGFTILELIVIIAVVTIITAMSWSALSGMKNRASINNACGQVSAMINKTRNYALSGKMVGGAGGSVPSSFSVAVNGSVIQISSDPVGLSESFAISGGVNCFSIVGGAPTGPWSSVYSTPNAVGAISPASATGVRCLGHGGSRDVEVTPYQAICK